MAARFGNATLMGNLDPETLVHDTRFAAVASFADDATVRTIRQFLSNRTGAIVPLLTSEDEVDLLLVERNVCIDTTSAGGNASLMAIAG